MEWRVVAEDGSRIEWERADRFVRVVLRETAGGDWAVTLDALEQAPEGPVYERETLSDRGRAEDLAAEFRDRHGGA